MDIKIEYIEGDLIQAFKENKVDVIAHQCNCTKRMSSGIAKVIANEFPELDELDKKNNSSLGDILYYNKVFNLYSQYYPGAPSSNKFLKDGYEIDDNFNNRIQALYYCLVDFAINLYALINNYDLTFDNEDELKIGFPLIASGLARDKTKEAVNELDYFKRYIAPIIENVLSNHVIGWVDSKTKIFVYYLPSALNNF